MRPTALLTTAASLLLAAASPAPPIIDHHTSKCATAGFNAKLNELSATLGKHGASLFPHLLTRLSATPAGCAHVYPLVTASNTILAPQDSAVTSEFEAQLTADPALVGSYYSTTTALRRADFFSPANHVIHLASAKATYWVGGMASLWMELKGTTTEAVVLETDIDTATGTVLILKNAWGQPASLARRGWPPCSTCK